jgi:hypothetical protein
MLNGDEVREHVFAKARKQVQEMALEGKTEDEIEASFDGELGETERDLVWLLTRHEASRGHYSSKYARTLSEVVPNWVEFEGSRVLRKRIQKAGR